MSGGADAFVLGHTRISARFVCHICMLFFLKVYQSFTEQAAPCCAEVPALESRLFRFYCRLLVPCNSAGFFLTIQNVTVLAGGQPLRCNDDTNRSSYARQHLLPAASVRVLNVLKLICRYKNICRELNGNRRVCCDPIVHRHYTVGLDTLESENITRMNELLEEQQGQRNPSVRFQFCFPVPPPSGI